MTSGPKAINTYIYCPLSGWWPCIAPYPLKFGSEEKPDVRTVVDSGLENRAEGPLEDEGKGAGQVLEMGRLFLGVHPLDVLGEGLLEPVEDGVHLFDQLGVGGVAEVDMGREPGREGIGVVGDRRPVFIHLDQPGVPQGVVDVEDRVDVDLAVVAEDDEVGVLVGCHSA